MSGNRLVVVAAKERTRKRPVTAIERTNTRTHIRNTTENTHRMTARRTKREDAMRSQR